MPRPRKRTATIPLFLVLAALAATQAGCPVTQDQDTPVREFPRIEPVTRSKYYLYVPSEYKPDRAWPLVVTLHGTHGFDSAKAQAKEWKALAEKHGFIVLAPSLVSPQGILPVLRSSRLKALEEDERRVLNALADVCNSHNVDRRAVMITGFSAGGYPLYYIALRHPDVFGALVARMCNFDRQTVETVPITDQARRMPMLVYFSKTANPLYSQWDPVAAQSWAAFRYLRENRCFEAEIDPIEGGHQRHPEPAVRFWKRLLPKSP